MDDDTFDPRSWLRPQKAPEPGKLETARPGDSAARPDYSDSPDGAPAPAPAPDAGKPDAGKPDAGKDALPEAWRDIGTEFGQQQLPPVKAKSQKAPKNAPRANRGSILPLIASLALIVAGAGAAWMTQIKVAPVAIEQPAPGEQMVTAATPSPEPVPGIEQRSLTLAGPGDIAEALTSAGVPAGDAQSAAQAAARVLTKPGEIHAVIEILPSNGGPSLQRLRASYSDGSGAVVARDASGHYTGTLVAAELTKKIKVLRGELDTDSFYSSAVAAGLVDTLIPEFINAFGFDFNLASEIAPGDTFEVAYEQSVDASGNPVGPPQLLFGSLTTKTKSLALYRFQPPGGEVGWYDGNGGSTKRGLMRTPVDGARITSKFGMRFHPVLHYTRLHAGVDFGVPIGTPVYAAADGVVTGATPTGCGGNMAVVQLDNGWVTRYFHLSRYADGLHNGQRVLQGYTLGLSGTTGTCTTGPHLHYELRINGEPVDPMGVAMDDNQKKKLEGPAMGAFIGQRNRVDVARAQ